MQLFIAYGYNGRDRWVEEMVFPIAEAIGWTVVHGRVVFGGPLSAEVQRLIESSDALIGFTTRRDGDDQQGYGTHPWVAQEISAAHFHQPRIPYVEVREQGVRALGGALDSADFQWISYREENRDRCLVEIAIALKRLAELTRTVCVGVHPEEVATAINRVINERSFRCEVETMNGLRKAGPFPAEIRPVQGALHIYVRGIRLEDLIRISIHSGGTSWVSDFEAQDILKVVLR